MGGILAPLSFPNKRLQLALGSLDSHSHKGTVAKATKPRAEGEVESLVQQKRVEMSIWRKPSFQVNLRKRLKLLVLE